MAAITGTILAATAVAGLGLSAYGMSQQMAGKGEQAAGAAVQAQGAKFQAYAAQQAAQGAQVQVTGAAAQNQATKAITGYEQQIEAQRFQAMELDARRQTMDAIRNEQRARALGLTNATSQGAAQGSGLQGGYGQISGQANQNILGIGQNLDIGRAIFGFNSGISQQKLAYAAGGDIINQGQGVIAQSQGWNAVGQGIIASGGGQIAAGAGTAGMGQGLSSLGGSLLQAAPTFANVGTYGASFFNTPTSLGSTYGGSVYGLGGSGKSGLY